MRPALAPVDAPARPIHGGALMTARVRQPIAAAILAGGLARRLGGANKATLRVGDLRIIDHQLAILREVADPVFIVSGRPEAFADISGSPRIVPDILPDAGPLGGIYTALVMS